MPCNAADRLVYNASTTIMVGNGRKAQFSHHSSINGEAPRNLAPHLFELVKSKNKSVEQELCNVAWIRILSSNITTTIQFEELLSLWIRLQNVQLQPEIRDSIAWRWTPDGQYSTNSADRVQFKGSYRRCKSNLI